MLLQGYKSLDEMIGKIGVLRARKGLALKKTANGLDASYIMDSLSCSNDADTFCSGDLDRWGIEMLFGYICYLTMVFCIFGRTWLQHGAIVDNGKTLDDSLLADPQVR